MRRGNARVEPGSSSPRLPVGVRGRHSASVPAPWRAVLLVFKPMRCQIGAGRDKIFRIENLAIQLQGQACI